jgi:hypothetical protein
MLPDQGGPKEAKKLLIPQYITQDYFPDTFIINKMRAYIRQDNNR